MNQCHGPYDVPGKDYRSCFQKNVVPPDRILAPGGAMEAFEAARKSGKCRFIGFTGHFDPEAHAALLRAYGKWDTVMMPLHAADHAYLSFEKTALSVARDLGVGVQAIKVFGKAFLLRSLSPTECLKYVLSQPGVHVAICGAGTQGQMEDNIRTVRNFKKMTPEEIADVRKRAVAGSGVYTGPTLEYWKRKPEKEAKPDMEIKRVGTQPSAKGPSDWFTGTVRIDPLFQAPDPALVQGASVTFEPALGPLGTRIRWDKP
jgi:hypothetical protein